MENSDELRQRAELLITDLIDTNWSRGSEVGLPPRFAGRIPNEGSYTVPCRP